MLKRLRVGEKLKLHPRSLQETTWKNWPQQAQISLLNAQVLKNVPDFFFNRICTIRVLQALETKDSIKVSVNLTFRHFRK